MAQHCPYLLVGVGGSVYTLVYMCMCVLMRVCLHGSAGLRQLYLCSEPDGTREEGRPPLPCK